MFGQYIFHIPRKHIQNCIEEYDKDGVSLDVCQEELSELIQAISKMKRAMAKGDESAIAKARYKIIEELTHAAISLGMLSEIFDINSIQLNHEVARKANIRGYDMDSYPPPFTQKSPEVWRW